MLTPETLKPLTLRDETFRHDLIFTTRYLPILRGLKNSKNLEQSSSHGLRGNSYGGMHYHGDRENEGLGATYY